jgi:uncharacterized LabA/DUF88 family protein
MGMAIIESVKSIEPEKPNLAFVDAQNMHFGTTKCYECIAKLRLENPDLKIENVKLSDCSCGKAWEVNLAKFRIYLKENYNVSEAYYFLGNLQDKNEDLYKEIQKAGFILVFKEHTSLVKSKKKGNVDTDLVFEVMKNMVDNPDFNQVILVSGDGDYKKLVNYLISKDKFRKILFPNKKFASSLYKEFGGEKFDYLENIRSYIA